MPKCLKGFTNVQELLVVGQRHHQPGLVGVVPLHLPGLPPDGPLPPPDDVVDRL